MPDIVIDQFNLSVKYQQDLLVFTVHTGQLIGYDDIELTVVDGIGDESEAQLKIENESNLNYQEDQGEVHTKQEYQNIQQLAKLELVPYEEGPTRIK